MKKLALITLSILICSQIMAQMPMNNKGGRPPQGGRPPMHNNMKQGGDEQLFMGIPDIPGLTLEQHEKLSKVISKERKDISKLMDKKHELIIKSEKPGLSEKDRSKLMDKVSKTDDKIRDKKEKYEKEYRSILTHEQYKIFNEKKKNIEFKSSKKPQRPDRPLDRTHRPDNNRERPEMPDENNMF